MTTLDASPFGLARARLMRNARRRELAHRAVQHACYFLAGLLVGQMIGWL